jgi:hypothetical protein
MEYGLSRIHKLMLPLINVAISVARHNKGATAFLVVQNTVPLYPEVQNKQSDFLFLLQSNQVLLHHPIWRGSIYHQLYLNELEGKDVILYNVEYGRLSSRKTANLVQVDVLRLIVYLGVLVRQSQGHSLVKLAPGHRNLLLKKYQQIDKPGRSPSTSAVC